MELMSNKFHCNGCGKPVTVRDYEQVIEWGKKCADCRVERVTGGIDEMKRNYVYKNLPVKKQYSYTVKVGESDNATTKPLGGVERMADIVYPCITKAVKEFRKNKQGNDYYVVFCTGTDTVESFSVNDNELEKKLSVLKETQQHKFLDLSNLSRIPVVKEECKELTTELLNFVLNKLPSDIVNKVVRIVFNISFLDKYRDEYIKTNDKQLFFGIDHVFRKPGFDTESYINFKQCDLSNFMLETNSGILKLKVKGEI